MVDKREFIEWVKGNGIIDYEEIVEENIEGVKEYVKNNDEININKLISKEKEINNRKTLLKWLERRK
ncbi:MAG: hypothetical protein ACOCP8_05340 [archaeon]